MAKRLLLVDDEAAIIKGLKFSLEQDGYEILTAYDGAEALEKFTKIDAVVNINIDFSLLMARLCGRRVCKNCGESYHVSTLGGKTTCERCDGELYQRADDNPETVQKRLDVYDAQTAPLIDYYTKKGLILNFTGTDEPPEVLFNEISNVLEKFR